MNPWTWPCPCLSALAPLRAGRNGQELKIRVCRKSRWGLVLGGQEIVIDRS